MASVALMVRHMDFYPRPPRGGRPPRLLTVTRAGNFYPRPPRGGRLVATFILLSIRVFLSTPSARRATIYFVLPEGNEVDFYPRPPRGGRPLRCAGGLSFKIISIHALREEGDLEPEEVQTND